MFKSIQYKLYINTALLIVVVVGLTCSILYRQYLIGLVLFGLFLVCLRALARSYKKYNQNFNFLLNALENGDYSFHFSETKLSVREKEMNKLMNRIKELLVGAKNEVIENEKYLSIIIDSVPTGIFIIDEQGIVHSVNNAALKILGLPVFTHINQLSMIDEKFPQAFRELKKGDAKDIAWNTERERISISVQVSEIKLKRGMMRVVSLHNISSELESKEMDSWIRLIRVMTHEIMNSIAPISSLSETMLSMYRAGDPNQKEIKTNSEEAFQTIHATATSLLSFVESYRKFTTIPAPVKQAVNINRLIRQIIKLEKNALQEKNIVLSTDFFQEDVLISADEKLVSQVLINLIKNAIEAVEESDSKQIVLSMSQEENGSVRIDVINNGQPIPADILPNIFIPFFTTKEEGSGIGLSISRQIMRLHGGTLQHKLTTEGMTTFSMTFPPHLTSN